MASDPQPRQMRLSTRQRQVLLAVRRCEYLYPDRRHLEYDVWTAGSELAFWSGLSIFGHLRKLSQRGYLVRGGSAGGYDYRLTDQGKWAVSDA